MSLRYSTARRRPTSGVIAYYDTKINTLIKKENECRSGMDFND